MADYEECTPEEFWEKDDEQSSAPAPKDSQAEHDEQIRKQTLLEVAEELLHRPSRFIIPIDSYMRDAPLIAQHNIAAWLQARAEYRVAPVISRLPEAHREHTRQWPPMNDVPGKLVMGWCSRRVGDGYAPDEHDGYHEHVRRGSCAWFVPIRRL